MTTTSPATLTDAQRLSINQASWDARTPLHAESDYYNLAGVRAGTDRIAPFEWDELGDVRGHDVVHLQCHLGTDSVSLARAGAGVLGVDFSAESVRVATELAAAAGVEAEFLACDVYDLPSRLPNRRFDVVFTGRGSVYWLPDIPRWAEVVVGLLRPGGTFYMMENHPLPITTDFGPSAGGIRIQRDYLTDGSAAEIDPAILTYTTATGGPVEVQGPRTVFQWLHPVGTVLTALAAAGLRIESYVEHDTAFSQTFPDMVEVREGWWGLPPGAPRIPLTYSVRGVRDKRDT